MENMSKVTPIFIIGLPRSGSTLIESILQSNEEKIQSIVRLYDYDEYKEHNYSIDMIKSLLIRNQKIYLSKN